MTKFSAFFTAAKKTLVWTGLQDYLQHNLFVCFFDIVVLVVGGGDGNA